MSLISVEVSVSPATATDMMYRPPRLSSWTVRAAFTADSFCSVVAPGARRNWSEVRPSPCTSALTWGASVASEGRMLHPILR